MKKLIKRSSLVVLFMVSILSLASAKPINDAIIAIVNSEVITLKDLKDYIGSIYRQLKVEHKTQQEIQETIATYEERGVNQLIEDKLILEAANKKGIEIRPDIIQKRLKEIRSRYPSEETFISELNTQGLTVTDIKNKILNQLKSKYIVDIEVREKIQVNPDEVTQYFNNHKDEFLTKTQYDLDSIFISFNNGKDLAKKKIEEAREKIKSGADFTKIASEYSESPSLGMVEQGQLVPVIEKEVFTLKKDDLSKVVEVDGGVYLFKVKDLVLGKKQSLEEAKDFIYNKLFSIKFQDKFEKWVSGLREKAYVEIR